MMQSQSIFDDADPATSLTEFLRSSAVVHAQYTQYDDPQQPPPQPHEALAAIIDDGRWTRRMLEDWFKEGPMRCRGGSVTPEPEFRALYLVLLGKILEREKQQKKKKIEEDEKQVSGEEVKHESKDEEPQKGQKQQQKQKTKVEKGKDDGWDEMPL